MAKPKMSSLDLKIKAAKACGLSYGQYVARFCYNTDLPQSVTVPEGRRLVCQHCGKVFFRHDNYQAKYCGDNCREDANRQAYRKRHPPKKRESA